MRRLPEIILILLLLLSPAPAVGHGAGRLLAGCLERAARDQGRAACPGLARALDGSALGALTPERPRGRVPVSLLRDLQAFARDYRQVHAHGPVPDPHALTPILAALHPPARAIRPAWLTRLRHWLAREFDRAPWRVGRRWLRKLSGSLHVPARALVLALDLAALALLVGGGWPLARLLRRRSRPARRRLHHRIVAAAPRAAVPIASEEPGTWLRRTLEALAGAGVIPPPAALSNTEVGQLVRSRAPTLARDIGQLAAAADAVSFGERRLPEAELGRLRALARALQESTPCPSA